MAGIRKTTLAASPVILVSAFLSLGAAKQGIDLNEVAPLSTPVGVTLQPLGKYQGYGMDKETAALAGHGQIAYADGRGMTLYTYGSDPLNGSACVGECEKTWAPLRVDSAAKPVRGWSIINRKDGTKQWALNGKALYTYTGDADPGSVGGNSPKRYGRGPLIGDRGARLGDIDSDKPLPAGWTPAIQFPLEQKGLPPEISVKEVEDAAGLVYIADDSRTLYVFAGDINADRKACPAPCSWKPYGASKLAGQTGKFLPVAREDGSRQWTYDGMGLYTFDGDLVRGDANGQKVHKDWEVAYFSRNYMPKGIATQESYRLGKVIADAKGRTLYRRDSYILQSGSGHGQRRGVLVRPAVGRDLGVDPRCVQECDKWRPSIAPADAKPQGFWSLYTRADGQRQWAYQGYALWTYDGDKKPGDINGNDAWQQYSAPAPNTQIDIGTQFNGVAALYWAAFAP